MRVTIKIDTDNDAFEENGEGTELGRILKELSNQVSVAYIHPGIEAKISDLNGNKVGSFKVTRTPKR